MTQGEDMTITARCKFYNVGYCKFTIKGCKFMHPKEICESKYCKNKNFKKRHPRKCQFEDRCKFGKKCFYKHENSKIHSEVIDKENKYIEKIKEENSKLLKQNKDKEIYIFEIEKELSLLKETLKTKESNLTEAEEKIEIINRKKN